MSGPERVVPVFPLGTVLFPFAVLPLHVFEPRYRVMVRRVLDGDHEFGVVLIERGSEVGGGDTRFGVGTIARVVQASELPDGRWALAVVGTRRFRVVGWRPDDPYPQAEISELDEAAVPSADAAAARDRAGAAFDRLTLVVRALDPGVGVFPGLDPDPTQASYEGAARAPVGPLDAQRLLEASGPSERLDLLARLLDDVADDLRRV